MLIRRYNNEMQPILQFSFSFVYMYSYSYVHTVLFYLISAELRSRMLVGCLEAKMLLLYDAVKQLLEHLHNSTK